MGVTNSFFGTKIILNGYLPEIAGYQARYDVL